MAYPSGAFVRSAPDSLFFSFFDQFFPEIRMGEAYDRLGLLPGRKALQADFAVLGDKPVYIGAGIGHDGTFF